MQWIISDLMAAMLKEIRVFECGHYYPQKQTPKSSAASLIVPSR